MRVRVLKAGGFHALLTDLQTSAHPILILFHRQALGIMQEITRNVNRPTAFLPPLFSLP